jgi:hypothetical protein
MRIERLQENLQKNDNFGRYGPIDESVIKFKERSSLKQYLPPKPRKKVIKFGIYVIQSLFIYSTIKSI